MKLFGFDFSTILKNGTVKENIIIAVDDTTYGIHLDAILAELPKNNGYRVVKISDTVDKNINISFYLYMVVVTNSIYFEIMDLVNISVLSAKHGSKAIFCAVDKCDTYENLHSTIRVCDDVGKTVTDNGGMYFKSLPQSIEYIQSFYDSIYGTAIMYRDINEKNSEKFVGFCRENKLEVAKKIIDKYMIHSYYERGKPIKPIHEYPAYNKGLVLVDISIDYMKSIGLDIDKNIEYYYDRKEFRNSKWKSKNMDFKQCLKDSISHIDDLIIAEPQSDIYVKIKSDFVELVNEIK